jgi:hypothetical protein
MADDANPYASPEAPLAPQVDDGASQAEAIRRAHIGREATIRAIGALALLGGILVGFAGISALAVLGQGAVVPEEARARAMLGTGLLVLLGGLYVVTGVLLRKVHPLGRVLFTVGFALGLASLVSNAGQDAEATGRLVGQQLLPALFTWILWSGRSRTIFSPRYRAEIVPQTPHVKYRTPTWLWVVVGLLVLLVLVAIASAVLTARA